MSKGDKKSTINKNKDADEAIQSMGANKDIESLSELASLVGAAQDALSDEMISRVASTFSEGMSMLDRVTRNEGLMHLVRTLDRPQNQRLLISLADALSTTANQMSASKPAKGGIGVLINLARDPATQEGLQLLSTLSKNLAQNMRENK